MLRHNERALLTDAELDPTLDEIDSLMNSLAQVHGLMDATVERWRWDEPTIVLTWRGDATGQITKNIAATLDPGDAGWDLSIEGTAWSDLPAEPSGLVREWTHLAIAQIPFSAVADLTVRWAGVETAIDQAYAVVSAWRRQDLT